MSYQVDIYGSLIMVPEADSVYVEDWGTNDPKEQYWRRRELPDFFNDVRKNKEGIAILTYEQEEYAKEEVRRCIEGFYFKNNGVVTYITGKNYFYLQWWFLEDAIYPDYRDADRRYFLFLNYWEHVLWCIGIGRGKKRREGASSQATANLIYECVFYTNSNCGLVSKTQIDSRDTFTDMAAFGYLHLPVFLKPRQLNREGSVTELVFAGKGDDGHRSKINYRAPVLNAYDRGRMTRVLADEGGKWPLDAPFSKFISIVSKTMVKGAKRVGFCEAPSTVNEMTKGGGAEFKKFWDGANQFKSLGKKTPNRFVTYFTPAYDNYEGFIDRYGMSVIGEPTEEQYEYLVQRWVVKDPITGETLSEISEEDIRKGARAYVLSRRVGLTGDLLEEEIRMNPCTVQEMFEAANTECAFNSYNINQRRRVLEEEPVYKRKVLFYRDVEGVVRVRDILPSEEKFHWKITKLPPPGEENKFEYEDRRRKPVRTDQVCMAVDGYSNSQGGGKWGSKASCWIGLRPKLDDPNGTRKPIGWLYGRPPVKEIFTEQVLLAAEYYSCQVWWEHVADDYFAYFRERGRLEYLGIYPISTIEPDKRKDALRHKGFPTTTYSLNRQTDTGMSYFEDYCHLVDYPELLEDALVFDPNDRTKSDITVSFLMLLVVLHEPVIKPPPRKTPLVRVYANA